MAEEISEAYLSKAKEATLAYYMNNIAQSLQRECGIRPPHSPTKVAEASKMDKYYQSEDSVHLKKAAEEFASKMEIIGMNIIQIKQQEKKSNKLLLQLEGQCCGFVRHEKFQKEYDQYEERIRAYVVEQMASLHTKLEEHKDEVQQSTVHLEELVNKNQKDTLWKIEDCEALLKTRITEQKTD